MRALNGIVAIAFLVSVVAAHGAVRVKCADGTMAKSGRGACARHGGIAKAAPSAGMPDTPNATVPTTRGAPKSGTGDTGATSETPPH